jgi:hypothetical protein
LSPIPRLSHVCHIHVANICNPAHLQGSFHLAIMSWWWSSKPSSKDGSSAQLTPEEQTPKQQAVPEQLRSNAQVESLQRVLTIKEQEDEEWRSILLQMQAESANAEERQKAQRAMQDNPRPAPQAATDISPNSLYPTEMSCRSAFDYAMFCQSFGGQFVNVYRYGSFRSCSNHWEDFWLCMRVRTWSKAAREEAIQEHYRKKAVKWKTGPSSEDIWEVRTEPVQNPISKSLVELEAQLAAEKARETGGEQTLSP